MRREPVTGKDYLVILIVGAIVFEGIFVPFAKRVFRQDLEE